MKHHDAYSRIREEIRQASVENGRHPDEVKMIAVTKNMTWTEASQFYYQGQRDFGESRYQSALEKQAQAPSDACWHFIGTLQSNKVRKVIGHFVLIHSVDTFELARKISQCSEEAGIVTSILLQSNTSGEASKQGLSPVQWEGYLDELLKLPALSIQGLMTMAPLEADESIARYCFSELRCLRDRLQMLSGGYLCLPQLSMGMSRDFKWAIAEGATLVRIGTMLKGS